MPENDPDLERKIGMRRMLGGKGHSSDNYEVARHVMQEEIDLIHGKGRPEYHFDAAIRDILLAHGRQDSAHALANTISLLKEIAWISKQVRFYGLVSISLLAVIAWKLWH